MLLSTWQSLLFYYVDCDGRRGAVYDHVCLFVKKLHETVAVIVVTVSAVDKSRFRLLAV